MGSEIVRLLCSRVLLLVVDYDHVPSHLLAAQPARLPLRLVLVVVGLVTVTVRISGGIRIRIRIRIA